MLFSTLFLVLCRKKRVVSLELEFRVSFAPILGELKLPSLPDGWSHLTSPYLDTPVSYDSPKEHKLPTRGSFPAPDVAGLWHQTPPNWAPSVSKETCSPQTLSFSWDPWSWLWYHLVSQIPTKGGGIGHPQICHLDIGLFWAKGTWENSRYKKNALNPFSSWKQDIILPCGRCPPCTRRKETFLSSEMGVEDEREICTNRLVSMTPTVLRFPHMFQLFSTIVLFIQPGLWALRFCLFRGSSFCCGSSYVNVKICMLFSCASALGQFDSQAQQRPEREEVTFRWPSTFLGFPWHWECPPPCPSHTSCVL